MQKPIVVVQLGISFGGLKLSDKCIWGYMEYWANEMALPFIEASKEIDMASDSIVLFEELED